MALVVASWGVILWGLWKVVDRKFVQSGNTEDLPTTVFDTDAPLRTPPPLFENAGGPTPLSGVQIVDVGIAPAFVATPSTHEMVPVSTNTQYT